MSKNEQRKVTQVSSTLHMRIEHQVYQGDRLSVALQQRLSQSVPSTDLGGQREKGHAPAPVQAYQHRIHQAPNIYSYQHLACLLAEEWVQHVPTYTELRGKANLICNFTAQPCSLILTSP